MEKLSDIFRFTDVEWIASEIGIAPPTAFAERKAAPSRFSPGNAIAFPGLINSHDHLDFNCYPPTGSPPYRDFVEWSRDVQAQRDLIGTVETISQATRMRFGLLKNLLWGVTAVANHGGKAIPLPEAVEVLAHYHSLHSPEFEPWARIKLLTGTKPVVMHIGEGTTPESRDRALALLRCNILHRPVAGVHAVSLNGDDFAGLEALIWCPASNLFLFGQTADVETATRRTRVLFGTDATLSAPGTLWDHLRQARGLLPDQDIFASLTTEAARFWRLPPSRRQQDFVVAERRKAGTWDAFFSVTPDDILMVVHCGNIVLLDVSLAEIFPPPPELSLISWRNMRKYVRLPIEAMFAELESSAPRFDQAALIERFAGVSA